MWVKACCGCGSGLKSPVKCLRKIVNIEKSGCFEVCERCYLIITKNIGKIVPLRSPERLEFIKRVCAYKNPTFKSDQQIKSSFARYVKQLNDHSYTSTNMRAKQKGEREMLTVEKLKVRIVKAIIDFEEGVDYQKTEKENAQSKIDKYGSDLNGLKAMLKKLNGPNDLTFSFEEIEILRSSGSIV